MSTRTEDNCIICIQQEVTRLISLCLDLGLELDTREDVRNLIQISGLSGAYHNPVFVEKVIDEFLRTV